MDIYNFSPLTGEYVATSTARLDPLEGKPMIPANATDVAPPAALAGHVRIFADGAWSQVEDNRGTAYWADGVRHEINAMGDTVPAGASLSAPPPPPITAAQVKAEANRRILAIVPEWKQRNLTAQAAQLAEKGRGNWSTEELAAWDTGLAIWAQVKEVRDASDLIEETAPIPTDFTDDSYWP